MFIGTSGVTSTIIMVASPCSSRVPEIYKRKHLTTA